MTRQREEEALDEFEDVIKCACILITGICLSGMLRKVGIIKPSTSA